LQHAYQFFTSIAILPFFLLNYAKRCFKNIRNCSPPAYGVTAVAWGAMASRMA
jgi:hypothetical protein